MARAKKELEQCFFYGILYVSNNLRFLFKHQKDNAECQQKASYDTGLEILAKCSDAPGWARTTDLAVNSRTLYRLSHGSYGFLKRLIVHELYENMEKQPEFKRL